MLNLLPLNSVKECPKCDSSEVQHCEYVPASEGWVKYREGTPEHLRRSCTHCGYDWLEAVKEES